jgi:O-antigen/teichoic acid export membrane protein
LSLVLAIPAARGRYARILRAVWSGGAARILSSLVGLLTLPLAVRYLGAARYGVWITVTTTAVWLNLLDLGIANTLTNQISQAYALGDKEAARRYFTNALVLTCAATALAGVSFAFLFGRIDWIQLFNVSVKVSSAEVRHTVAVAVGLMLLALPCSLGSKLLAGYQELHRSAYATGAGAVATLLGLALGIALHVSMPVLYVMSMGCTTFASLFLLLLTISRKPWLLPRCSAVDRVSAKELLGSGSSFFLIQVAAVVVFSSDNIIVSHYLGASEVTPYSVTWRVAGLAAVLQSLIFPALWPAYAEAYARHDYLWIRQTFMATMKGILGLNVFCALGLICFGRMVIRLWAGAAAVPDRHMILAMALWIIVSGFMSVESCLLAALNRTRGQAILSVGAAVVNVVLSVTLVRSVGALGVIGGTILSYVAVLIVPQTLIVRSVWRRELQAEGRPQLDLRPSPSLSGGED